ncbi:MAG: AAA family ATPase, partial [Synergistaceae bacterium]|nr:AAA family ATPase [Synergistaceae bacterium]
MILHSITVENWRCLVGETTVGPFSEGLNILYAPNATGKSTLFEALRCALMDNHATQGKDIQQLRPWGRELSPRVMVEFSAKDCRYRVRKRFLEKPESLLERMEGEIYRPLAEGPKADSITRELFSPKAPKVGMSRPEHWGIQQVLWTPQGKLELDGLSGDLLASIRQALSIQVVDSGIRAVEEELKARYGMYFTPTGRLRTGSGASSLPFLEDSIKTKGKELESKRLEYQETEDLSLKVKTLSSRLEELRSEARRSDEDLKMIEGEAANYNAHLGDLEKAEAEAKAAESEYLRRKALFTQVSEIRGEIGEIGDKVLSLRNSLPVLEEELKVCTVKLETKKAEFAEAQKAKNNGEALLDRAREASRLTFLQEKIQKESEALEQAYLAKKNFERAESEGAEKSFPGSAEIQKIRKAFEILEEARIMLDASLITLEITPEAPFKARVDSGETPG